MLRRKKERARAVLELAYKATNMNAIDRTTTNETKAEEDSEMYREFSNLIPGLHIITNKHTSVAYRISWALILVVFLVLILFQLGNRLHVYLSDKTVFQSRVTVNDTVHLPTFTICADKVYASYDKRKEYAEHQGHQDPCTVPWTDIVGFKGQDVEDVWSSYQTRDIINVTKFPEAQQVHPDSVVVKRTPVRTILGMCENLDLSENIVRYEYGHITYLRITFIEPQNSCDYTAIKIRVHDPQDCIRHQMLRQSLEISVGFYVDIIITSYKKIVFMNRKKNPCLDKKNYNECINKCLDTLISKGLKCRLPFMDVNLPNCKDNRSTEEAFRKAEGVYNNNPQCPQCAKRCVEDKFTVLISPWRTGQNDIMLGIYYKENMFQTATEVWEYEFLTLVADIGGNIGLFLGFCIIHLLELFDTVITNAGRKIYKWIIK